MALHCPARVAVQRQAVLRHLRLRPGSPAQVLQPGTRFRNVLPLRIAVQVVDVACDRVAVPCQSPCGLLRRWRGGGGSGGCPARKEGRILKVAFHGQAPILEAVGYTGTRHGKDVAHEAGDVARRAADDDHALRRRNRVDPRGYERPQSRVTVRAVRPQHQECRPGADREHRHHARQRDRLKRQGGQRRGLCIDW